MKQAEEIRAKAEERCRNPKSRQKRYQDKCRRSATRNEDKIDTKTNAEEGRTQGTTL